MFQDQVKINSLLIWVQFLFLLFGLLHLFSLIVMAISTTNFDCILVLKKKKKLMYFSRLLLVLGLWNESQSKCKTAKFNGKPRFKLQV